MAAGQKMEFDPEQGVGKIANRKGDKVFVVHRQHIIDFFAFEKGHQLSFEVDESDGEEIAYDVIGRYRLSDIRRVVEDAPLFQQVESEINNVITNAVNHNPLSATFAKNYGWFLGLQFANDLNSGHYEPLRQLMVIFPMIDLYYLSDSQSVDEVQDRLKFNLAMWLGDNSNKQELVDVAEKLKVIIEKIRNPQSWKMYKHFIQTMIAEFKLRVG